MSNNTQSSGSTWQIRKINHLKKLPAKDVTKINLLNHIEEHVLYFTGNFYSVTSIAKRLNTTPETIYKAKANIRKILGVREDADVIRFCQKTGFSDI